MVEESGFVRLPPSMEEALRPIVDEENRRRIEPCTIDELFTQRGVEKDSRSVSLEDIQLKEDGYIEIIEFKDRSESGMEIGTSYLRPTGRGFYYFELRDELDARREAERKQDKKHDWMIALLSAVAGIAGVVIGFALGRF